MTSAYIFILVLYSTVTNAPIGAQTFTLQNKAECLELKQFADTQTKLLPENIKGRGQCFLSLGNHPVDL